MVRQPAVYGGHHEGQVLHPGQLSDIRGVLLLLRRHINVPGVQHPRQGDGDSVELRGDPVPLRPSTDRLPPHPRASHWVPRLDVLQEWIRRLLAGDQLHDRGQHPLRVRQGHPGPSQHEGSHTVQQKNDDCVGYPLSASKLHRENTRISLCFKVLNL